MAFEAYMQEHIFRPLAMSQSGYSLTPEMKARLTEGHLDGSRCPHPPLRDTPALGFYTTTQDMSKFLNAVLRRELPGLSPKTLESMWQVKVNYEDINGHNSIGLGWFVENTPKLGRVVRHGGTTMLFGAEMALLPDKGLGIVVMANGAHSNHLTRELAAAILALASNPKGVRVVEKPAQQSSPRASKTHGPSGSYATSLGLLLVESDNDKLCACIIERVLDLARFDDGSFALTRESAASLPESYRILGELKFSIRPQQGEEVLVGARK
jgi:CubicO group peptidase (beta-lactamase class C family)